MAGLTASLVLRDVLPISLNLAWLGIRRDRIDQLTYLFTKRTGVFSFNACFWAPNRSSEGQLQEQQPSEPLVSNFT